MEHAKIYQIINSKGQRYVGSTSRKYHCQRMAEHVYTYNEKKKGVKIYCCSSDKVLEDGDYKMELLQDFPCSHKNELFQREQFFIDNLKGVVNVRKVQTFK